MNHCLHGVFMPREYPQEDNWSHIQAQCLDCGEEFTYWEDRNDIHQEALSEK